MESIGQKINDIVYSTIREYQNSHRFKKYKLEEYDNWKDEIIDRIEEFIKNDIFEKLLLTDSSRNKH